MRCAASDFSANLSHLDFVTLPLRAALLCDWSGCPQNCVLYWNKMAFGGVVSQFVRFITSVFFSSSPPVCVSRLRARPNKPGHSQADELGGIIATLCTLRRRLSQLCFLLFK